MAAVAMVTILNSSRARRGSIRSLADEDIPGVHDDDGDEHFVTDTIPESCIIHRRDVRKTEPCADLLPRMSKRASYAQVQIASSGEPTMIEKICTIHQYRPVASDKLSRALRPAPDHVVRRRTRNRAFTGKKISTAYMDQAAIQLVPTSAGSWPPVPVQMGRGRLRPRPCARATCAVRGPRADANVRACVGICVRYWRATPTRRTR